MKNTAKYEFTDETRIIFVKGVEHQVKRIRALKEFNPPNKAGEVHKGDLGGWIESESNLSHDNMCWVDEEAAVMDDAVVKDNAYVCDNALVYENAVICENGTVSENAMILGNVVVCGDSHISGNAAAFGYLVIKDTVTVMGYTILTNFPKVNAVTDSIPLSANTTSESSRTILSGDLFICQNTSKTHESSTEDIFKIYNASNYLYCIRENFLQSDEMEFSMEMFKTICVHIKNIYQHFYDGGNNRNEIISFLEPYQQLVKIADFPEIIDMEHEIIKLLALLTIRAIRDIRWKDSKRNQFRPLGSSKTSWYDFDNDTEETLWKRLKDLIQNNEGFYIADIAYEMAFDYLE